MKREAPLVTNACARACGFRVKNNRRRKHFALLNVNVREENKGNKTCVAISVCFLRSCCEKTHKIKT